MTFAEFERLPDLEAGKRELVNGEAVTMPPPKLTHTRIARSVFFLLAARFGRERTWHDHTGYRLGDNWLEPDVSVTWPDQQVDESDYFLGAPMIAVEVLSAGEDIDSKITLYLHGGAREVWVINPRLGTLVVYTAEARVEVTDEYRSALVEQPILLADVFR